MENLIVTSAKTAIKHHEEEIQKYNRVLMILEENENHNPRRYARLGKKRGPYKKRETKNTLRVPSKGIQSPNWDIEIPAVLRKNKKGLNSRQIIEAIAPGKHKKTMKVLSNRCNAILSIYKKKGLVKVKRTDDGTLYLPC